MHCANFEDSVEYIIDLAKQARSSAAKVAPEYYDKSYNASRKEYFYGAELHAVVVHNPKKFPVAEMQISPERCEDFASGGVCVSV